MVNISPPELDAQHAVLGAVLIQPDIAGELIQAVAPEDFTDATCRNVFDAIREQYISGERLDAVTVLHRLGADGYRTYLSQLMDVTPTAAGWQTYAAILRDEARLYRIRQLADEILGSATLELAQGAIAKLFDAQTDSRRKTYTVRELFPLWYERQAQPPDYLDFGIEPLDNGNLFAALGDFIVIGARPSVGKTALAIQLARHMAQGRRVGFFSAETGALKFFDRYVAGRVGIDFGRIKRHELDENDDMPIMTAMREDHRSLQLEMVQASGMAVSDIRAQVLARRYEVIFVDYLQLLAGSGRDSFQRVTQISMELHNLAQQCNVAVIALAQLRRGERTVNRKTGKTFIPAPTLADLRESGQIEQDADIVLLMYLKDPDNTDGARMIHVAKNKEGRHGRFRVAFDGSRQRFTYVPDEDEKPPHPAESEPPQRPKKTEPEQMNMLPERSRRTVC